MWKRRSFRPNSRGAHDDRQAQRRAIRVEQVVQGPADGVVAQKRHPVGGEVQKRRMKSAGPVADAVERFPGQNDVVDKKCDRLGGRKLSAGVGLGEVGVEKTSQAQAPEEPVDDRKGVEREILQHRRHAFS